MKRKIIKEILEKESPKIVITTHRKPDGDAMGSTLALYNFFRNIDIETTLITPTNYADFLSWLPGNEDVIIYTQETERSNKLISEADYVFCLDFNRLSRIDDMGVEVEKSNAQTILIDHHQDPAKFDDMTWWNSKASSTCEQIYKFIIDEGYLEAIDVNVATCIYTGIMTDTGSFRFRGVNSDTHRIAAHLIDVGIIPADIHSNILDSFSEQRLKLIGFAISERLEYIKEYNTALIYLTKEDTARFNVVTGDTEGLVNYGLSIKGVRLATLIIDRGNMVKMSFRSKGDFDVNKFAREHFNGGGHINAAGGSSSDSIENEIEKFKSILPQYKSQLI